MRSRDEHRADNGSRNALIMLACLALAAFGGIVLGTTANWGMLALIAVPAVFGALILLLDQVRRFEVNVFLLTFAATLVWYVGPLVIAAVPGSPILPPADAQRTSASLALISISLAPVWVAYILLPGPALQARWTPVLRRPAPITALLALFAGLQIGLIVIGAWTYGGGAGEGAIRSVVQFTTIVTLFAGPAAGALAGRHARRHGLNDLRTLSLVGMVLVSLLWALIAGRRSFAAATLLSGMSFLVLYGAGQSIKTRVLHAIVAAVIGLTIVAAGSQAFFMVRLATYAVQQGAPTPDIVELFRRSRSVDVSAAEAIHRQNLGARPVIIETVNAFEHTATGRLNGEAAWSALLTSVPVALFPDKPAWERKGVETEALWSRRLGVPRNDWAMTLLIEGYSDFGHLGLLVYLILIHGLASLLRWMSLGDRTAEAMAALPILSQMLNVEISLSAYLATARNAALLIAGWWLLSLLLQRFTSPRDHASARGRTAGAA